MKFPLIQGSYTARSVIANVQRCVNLYAEKNTPDAEFPYTFYPRPGYTLLSDLGAAAGVARCDYVASNGEMYSVVGDAVYYVAPDWTHTALGTIGTLTGTVCMADNGLAVLIVDGSSSGYCIDLTSGTHTFGAVNDAAFYGADRVDYVDTYFILNRSGTNQFYISLSNVTFANLSGTISPNSLYAAFDPLDIAAKTGWPDALSGLIVMRREIWLIGEKTTEIWFNSGDTNFTFQEMPGVIIEHGCIATYSIAKQDVSVFWLGQDLQGRAIVIEGTQYAAKRISTHAIENEFAGYSTLSDAIGGVYQVDGHVFYKLTFPTANKTWVYDAASGFWHEDIYTDNNGAENRSLGIYPANAYGVNVERNWQTGALYKVDLASYLDDGQPIVRRRGFPHLMQDGDRVSYQSFISDVSVGSGTNQVTSVTVGSGGSGYTSPPAVVFSGGGGSGATAAASIDLEISSISITDGGTGYTSAPSVSFTGGGGTGATATSSVTNGVSTLSITSGGTGYTSVPAVTFSGGGGSGASAEAALSNYVSSISVTGGGSGYSSAPAVAITDGGGAGATATAALSNGTVTSLTLTNTGSGYTSTPSVAFSGGGGSGAAATATLSAAGVSGVTVTSGGSFATSAVNATFSGGGGSGAAAGPILTRTVYAISLTNAGSGYSSPPTVTISGGGGSGATAIATGFTASNGLTAIIIGNNGHGYTSAPSVIISGGSPTVAATAVATLGYSVTAATVTNPGSGYTSAPSVLFTSSGGTVSNGIGTATINAAQVASVAITAAGSGYTSAPTVSFSGGGGSGAAAAAAISASVGSVTVTAGGGAYTSPPTVSFSGGGGSGATATSALLAVVSSLSLTSPGSGYTSAPTIGFTGGGGSGATAAATVASRVSSVTVTSPGTGYTSAPAVSFTGGGGSGAAATANLSGPVVSVALTRRGGGYTSTPTVSFSGGGGSGATASATIDAVTPLITLRWSDNRGVSWNSGLTQSLGRGGAYLTQPQWSRLGMARDRVFELYWSYPAPTALNGAWVEMTKLGS